jgi:hypothetical protein
MRDLIQLYATTNIRVAELERENAALLADNAAAHALVLDLRAKEHAERTLAVRLEKENLALREDKERLDSGRILLRCHDSFQGWQSVEFIGQDLRAAIDAARKEQP